nr:hypothetical protein [Tanacetum cinerariifolium]
MIYDLTYINDDNDEKDDDDQEDEGDDDEDDEEEGNDDEQASGEEEFIHPSLSTHAEKETKDEESFDPIPKTPENTDDEGNGEENLGTNVGREEGHNEKEEEDELYRDVNINLGRGIQTTQEFEDSHVTQTLVNPDGQQQSSSMSSQFVTMAPLPMSAPTLTSSTIATITTTIQAPTPPTTASSTLLQDLPNFGSLFGFDNRLKTLEENFSEFMQTNQFAGAVSSIPRIVQRYMDQRMNEVVEIIKEHVKEQVKVQVSKILPKIEHTVNEQLEAEVLTRSSNSSKTSYAIAADLSEMELKKILIEKIKGNKETITLNRRHDDDADKDEEPSVGSDWRSKRRRERKEHESVSAPKEKATRSAGKSTQGSKSRQTLASESATAKEPMQTTFEMKEPLHPEFKTGADDQLIVEPSQHLEWFSQQKKPPTPDQLLDGPIYELMKGSCKNLVKLKFFLEEVYKATTDQLDWVNLEGQQYPHNLLKPLLLIPNSRGHRVIPFDHFINNDLEYLRGVASSRKYTIFVTKTNAGDYGHIKWIKDLVPRKMWIQEPRRIIAVTELKIVEWHNYKHLDWITVRRDNDKLYKFNEGDFKRLRIQDIEDMLLLFVQGKLTHLTVEERFAFNVSIRMFTRSTNKDKQNSLNRIDELHKFSDGMLTDVRTTLDDRLKRIQMKYLPKSIWRKSDKDRAAAMI